MTDQPAPQNQVVNEDDDSISLLDLLLVLAAGHKTIFNTTVVFACVSVAYALVQTNIYTAKTNFIPPSSNQLMAQSALNAQATAMLGGGLAAALKNPADLWVSLLKSDSVKNFVILQNHQQEVFKAKNIALAMKTLEGMSKINADKSGLVTIEVDNKDPELAAKIANSYVAGLNELNKRLVFSQAGQKRLFFEQQLQQARDGLTSAEQDLSDQLLSQGVAPDDIRKRIKTIPRAADETAAQLRGQIAAKELQISAMKSYATDQNLALIQAQQELVALQDKLSSLQGLDDAQIPVAANSPPPAQAANQKAIQDIRYYDSYIQTLMDQYEQARLDEAKEPSVLQVVDIATPPGFKSKPNRARIVIIGTLAGLFLSMLWIFLKNALQKMNSNPEMADKIKAFNEALPIRAWVQSKIAPKLVLITTKIRPLAAHWHAMKGSVWPPKK